MTLFLSPVTLKVDDSFFRSDGCSVVDTYKLMVSRLYESMWNQRDLALVADRFANDFLGHSTDRVYGKEDIAEWADTLFHAFPDSVFTIQDQIAEADKVVTRWTACGIHVGEFQGFLPTGKLVTVTGIDLFRIANRKIIEGWMIADIRRDKNDIR